MAVRHEVRAFEWIAKGCQLRGVSKARDYSCSLRRRILFVGKPFEIKARQREHFMPFIKAKDNAIIQHRQVRVGAVPLLQALVHRPGLAFIVAQLDGKILPVPMHARFFPTLGVIQIIGIGK